MWIYIIPILIFLIIFFLPGRVLTDYESEVTALDDVSPYTISIERIEYFLKKHQNESVVLFITPFYHHKTNLTGNMEWVQGVKELRKKYNFNLGLHGHSHRLSFTEYEFLLPNPWKISKAREEFKRAFGFYPELFRAPCFCLDVVDYVYVKSLGMKNYGWYGHGKNYHPDNLDKHWYELHPSFLGIT